MKKIQIIVGATRTGRHADKFAEWTLKLAEENKQKYGVEFEVVDLKDYPLPFYDDPGSPAYGVIENPDVKKWAAKVGEASGYIIVTPEYNHGYPAVLKNSLDYVFPEWNNKPVGFVSYGGASGGARAVEQLRQVVVELMMIPVRHGVHVNYAWEAVDENGYPKDPRYAKQLQAMIEQVVAHLK